MSLVRCFVAEMEKVEVIMCDVIISVAAGQEGDMQRWRTVQVMENSVSR